MMQDTYSVSPRRARIIRLAAVLFLMIGLASLIGTVASMIRPGLSVQCDTGGCIDRTNLIDLAPADARPALSASRPAQAVFARHVARPLVRTGLASVRLIDDLPFPVLMLSVTIALRHLAARRGNDLSRALPWLKLASIAALFTVVIRPVAASVDAMILFPGTPSGAMWYFELDVRRLAFDGLLALTAFAVVWALDAGSRAERDMAGFI